MPAVIQVIRILGLAILVAAGVIPLVHRVSVIGYHMLLAVVITYLALWPFEGLPKWLKLTTLSATLVCLIGQIAFWRDGDVIWFSIYASVLVYCLAALWIVARKPGESPP